jgi:hypothetical protein
VRSRERTAGSQADGVAPILLILDTEGLGSTDRSATYDARIFAMALLLSSFFMYK